MNIAYKKSEQNILMLLRKNGRMSLRDISAATGIPISTVHEKIKLFEPTVVRKYTTFLNFAYLGYPIQLYFMFKAKKENKEQVFGFLMSHSRMNSVYKINHGYDFLCHGYFESMQDAEQCFLHLEERFAVSKIQSFYILEEMKREEFFSGTQL